MPIGIAVVPFKITHLWSSSNIQNMQLGNVHVYDNKIQETVT